MSGSVNNWQSRPLGELATTTSGGTPSRKRKDYYGGSIPWVKSGELNDDYIFETEEHITEAGLKNSSAKIFSSGTVLIALYGATVGKTSILRTDASTNQAVCGITPGPDLDAGYLRYHLISLRRVLLSHRYGGAQPNISQQIVRNQKIAYPPLPEQKKIAHILSTVQRAIEAQERIIQTTIELKKALMHKLFTEGLHNEPQKQTEIGPVPESWEVVEFDRFSTLQRGKDLTKTQFQDGDVPVAGSNGVIGFHNAATCVGPGVTVGRSGSAGKVIFYAGDFWAHNTSLYVRDFHGNHPRYVAYFLEHLDLARFKTGASVPTLDRNSFKNMPVPVPSVSEQSEIAEALVTTDRKVEIAAGKKASLQDLFRTLLHELMSAKTRVDHLNNNLG